MTIFATACVAFLTTLLSGILDVLNGHPQSISGQTAGAVINGVEFLMP